jgi:DNA-binding transcriptional regulator YdaS (Cro superfamily)
MDALNKAIEAAGGISKLALAIGEAQNTVSNWRARGRVPVAPCARVEMATGVRRWEFFPNDWHLIWPELCADPDAPPRPGSSAFGELAEGTNTQPGVI